MKLKKLIIKPIIGLLISMWQCCYMSKIVRMYVLSFGQWQVLIKSSMLKAQYVERVIKEP